MSAVYPSPDAAFDSDAVILAKKGAGKTVLAKGVVERDLDNGERVVIIDPKGDWYGLKSSADGEREGYAVAVFGGRYADLPFTEETGVPIADRLAATNLPAIIDISEYPPSRQPEVLLPFLTRLYQKNRASILLCLDEAHRLAPQTPQGRTANALRDLIQQIVTMGRQRGFRVLSICQRTSLIDKTVLSQADTLITMRLTHKDDKKRPLDWAHDNAPEDFSAQMADGIGTLKQGEAFVGSISAEFFERVRVPLNSTFDSSKTPARGEIILEPKRLSEVDLSAVHDALTAGEVTEPDDTEPEASSKDVERRIAAAHRAGRDEGIASVDQDDLKASAYQSGKRDGYLEACNLAQTHLSDILRAAPGTKQAAEEVRIAAPTEHKLIEATAPKPVRHSDDDLTAPQIKVLNALAFWFSYGTSAPSREQVAFAAGYSPKSGGFRNLLSSLRTLHLIDYPSDGYVSLTNPRPLDARRASLSDMLNRLSRPQNAVLKPLLNGAVLDRETLADAANYSASSGGFRNLLSSLRTLKLIDYPDSGQVAAEPWLVRLS